MERVGKVRMNYTYYSGEDSYSDGDIEEELLNILDEGHDVSELLDKEDRWPVLYHFSPNRHNLLEWFDFGEDKDLLEIGAGCGAITGLLCEKVRSVTCIELSKKRSLINAKRHMNFDNLEIIIGNLNDIKFEKKYDYITLIGVLEYAALYTDSQTPYVTFLENIKENLKENGKLIIAIENKLGLKYWAGSREDHTGGFFDSIQNYPQSTGVATFSKAEIIELFQEVGFNNIEFMYPYPDYKLPTQLFSDKRLPNYGELKQATNYDQNRIKLFDEESAANNIIQNGMFPEFSNSFLIFCS